MVKICPNCASENSDDSFWCKDCNTKLVSRISEVEKEIDKGDYNEKSEEKFDFDNSDTYVGKSYRYSFFKIPIIIIFVCILIYTSYYFVSNIETDKYNWDQVGGFPLDNTDLFWEDNGLPWTENLKIENAIEPLSSSYSFSDIGEFGTDYWFSGNNIETSDGWTFEYQKVKDCEFEAVVLNYYVYNKDGLYYYPSEIFSPLDIFFGHDDIVKNPNNYKYSILNNFYRGVQWTCHSDNYPYFKSHTTNTHLIAHNKNVLSNMKNIEIGNVVSVTGSYVNLNGRHPSDSRTYTWTTDDQIGNYHCEIILIESFQIK